MTAQHPFAVKSLFCTIFTSGVQQTLSKQATNMKFKSDIYSTVIPVAGLGARNEGL
jgi:hypothetical protein